MVALVNIPQRLVAGRLFAQIAAGTVVAKNDPVVVKAKDKTRPATEDDLAH